MFTIARNRETDHLDCPNESLTGSFTETGKTLRASGIPTTSNDRKSRKHPETVQQYESCSTTLNSCSSWRLTPTHL